MQSWTNRTKTVCLRPQYIGQRHKNWPVRESEGRVGNSLAAAAATVESQSSQVCSGVPASFLNVVNIHDVWQPHSGVSLSQSDERLQLTRIGRHLATPTSHLTHLHVSLNESLTCRQSCNKHIMKERQWKVHNYVRHWTMTFKKRDP